MNSMNGDLTGCQLINNNNFIYINGKIIAKVNKMLRY